MIQEPIIDFSALTKDQKDGIRKIWREAHSNYLRYHGLDALWIAKSREYDRGRFEVLEKIFGDDIYK